MHKVLLFMALFSVALAANTLVRNQKITLQDTVYKHTLRYLGRVITSNKKQLTSCGNVYLTCETIAGQGLIINAKKVVLRANALRVPDQSIHINATSDEPNAIIIYTSTSDDTVYKKISSNKPLQIIHTEPDFEYRAKGHTRSETASICSKDSSTADAAPDSVRDFATQTEDPLNAIFLSLQLIQKRLDALDAQRSSSIWGHSAS